MRLNCASAIDVFGDVFIGVSEGVVGVGSVDVGDNPATTPYAFFGYRVRVQSVELIYLLKVVANEALVSRQ